MAEPMACTPDSGGEQPAKYIEPNKSDDLVALEQKLLRQEFGKGAEEVWTGLALSGGGVRSATFCLGALQALNEKGILYRFDYQSTVSGGGFSGLSWLWYRRSQEDWKFPFSETDPAYTDHSADGNAPSPGPNSKNKPRDTPLSFLRRNIGYLNPSSRIDYFSGAVAVLRTVLLNLLVWVPLITSLLCVIAWVELRIIAVQMGPPAPGWSIYAAFPLYGGIAVLGLFLVAVAAACSVAASLALGRVSEFLRKGTGLGPMGLVKVAALVGLIILGGLVLYDLEVISISGQFPFVHMTPTTPWDRAWLTAYVLAAVVIVLSTWVGRQREYLILRKLDEYASFWTPLALAFLVIGAMPLIPENIMRDGKEPGAGLLALLSLTYGVIAAIYSHYMSFRNLAPGLASKVLIISGAAVFLFGLILLCFYFSELMVPLIKSLDCKITNAIVDGRPLFGPFHLKESQFRYETIMIAAILISAFALFYTNINQIGLHRYYRDRIAETFFADRKSLEVGVSGSTVDGISITIDELTRGAGESLHKPYPIVNMNAIMIDDEDTKTKLRGGANFIASPYYAGSDATGWLATSIYGGPKVGRPLHAATVAAASGAAVNSSAGYAGTGITRNRIVSIAMRLLNVRLGYWLVNPRWIARHQKSLRWTTKTVPTHYRPGLTHLLSRNWNHKAKFVELTDGGHFDNLGVYELVRRRCGIIVVCDGEADKDTSYSGLVSVARRVQEDFGASFHFEAGMGPERMVANLPLGYPSKAKAAASPYMVARVNYPKTRNLPAMSGIVIYIKATMIDDVGFVTKGYKGSNPDFPHQSTVDQFFQAEQFEAYRELGLVATRKCIRELNADRLLGNPSEIWSGYLHNNRQSNSKQKNEQGNKIQ